MRDFWCWECDEAAIEGDHECKTECDACQSIVPRTEVAVTANGTICILCLEKQVAEETEQHP